MKYLILMVISAFLFGACNNNNSNENEPETYRQTPVQNVNGNIPDTTNSIDLSTRKPADNTEVKDTTR